MHGDDHPWPCTTRRPLLRRPGPRPRVRESPPAVTLDAGIAAAYQAIAGEALPLVLDARLAQAVTGRPRRLASPGLVLHLSVGASTVATKRVIANLFYRGVLLRRPVFEGETLSTTTRVLAMADGSRREGQAPRGKALLGIVTTAGTTLDDAEPVLDYQRCPLIRLRGDELPGHADDLGTAAAELDLDAAAAFVPEGWDLEPLGAPTDMGRRRDPRPISSATSSTEPRHWCGSPTTSPPSTATPRRRPIRSASSTADTPWRWRRRRSAA